MQQFRSMIALVVWSALLAGSGPSVVNAGAVELDSRGQASGWLTESRHRGSWDYTTGLRYIPEFSIANELGVNTLLDFEISINGFASAGSDETFDDSDVELYRLKLRFATSQTETRLGLQKLNFGPAMLLRPLRWFDRLDPRDPLQLTDGVYALRFKYDTLNNISLWLWGLYGNDEIKGSEFLPTVGDKPEFGGRLQCPVPAGEMAVTFHRRRVDAANALTAVGAGGCFVGDCLPAAASHEFTETRFAVDGRWDIEIGLWCEAVFQRQRLGGLLYEWAKFVTLGMDYTFGIGNGINVLAEHQATIFSDELFRWDEDAFASAFYLNYMLGYFDNLSAIGFYSWESEKYYQYMSWQRTWDNLILNVSFFFYPETDMNQGLIGQKTAIMGNGGQILVVYNH